MVKCLIDDTEFESIDVLQKYLRALNYPQSKYYQTYYPRKDLWTKEILSYKDYHSYFCSFFENRDNMKKWLKGNSPSEILDVIKQMFLARKEHKCLVYAPTEIELKTCCLPSLAWFKVAGLDYYEFCKQLGFKNRFQSYNSLSFSYISSDMTIITDTREKKPLLFGQKNITKKIDEGDYSVEPPYFSNVFIERKSLVDFCGTMSSGYERFCREIARAESKKSYIVILIEENMARALDFSKCPELKYISATESFIYSRVRSLLQTYNNIQFLFVNGREECARIIPKLFSLKDQVKIFDLQSIYDGGLL